MHESLPDKSDDKHLLGNKSSNFSLSTEPNEHTKLQDFYENLYQDRCWNEAYGNKLFVTLWIDGTLSNEPSNEKIIWLYPALWNRSEEKIIAQSFIAIDQDKAIPKHENLFCKSFFIIAWILAKEGDLDRSALEQKHPKEVLLHENFRQAIAAWHTKHTPDGWTPDIAIPWDVIEKYRKVNYAGTTEKNDMTAIYTQFNDNRTIKYRGKDMQTYDPINKKGHFDCVQLVRFFFSDKWKNRRSTKTNKIKYFNFREMFAQKIRKKQSGKRKEEENPSPLILSGYMSPEIYANYVDYKASLQNIQIGDIIGLGEEVTQQVGWYIEDSNMRTSMSHGGIVSRVVKNDQGEIVNVYMTHSTLSDQGAWPTEVLLFGPKGYYATYKNANPRGLNKKHKIKTKA